MLVFFYDHFRSQNEVQICRELYDLVDSYLENLRHVCSNVFASACIVGMISSFTEKENFMKTLALPKLLSAVFTSVKNTSGFPTGACAMRLLVVNHAHKISGIIQIIQGPEGGGTQV